MDEPDESGAFFDPAIKCCTYYPALPGFLIGRILGDDSRELSEGRAVLAEILASGAGVTPLGLRMPPRYRLLFRHAETAYGRTRELLCPFFLQDGGGRCGIWPHRMAMCATWYCKHLRGAVGTRFWRALESLLLTVERDLSLHCALDAALAPEQLERLLPSRASSEDAHRLGPADVDGERDHPRHSALWGARAGHEDQYFAGCADLVAGLGWSDVLAIGGSELRVKAALARAAFDDLLTPSLPDRLRQGSYQVLQADTDLVRISTYTPYDPLVVPRALINALYLFDGRPTTDVMKALVELEGLEVEPGLVRLLVDFDVLVPADEPRSFSQGLLAVRPFTS
jgi:hypothetical protein